VQRYAAIFTLSITTVQFIWQVRVTEPCSRYTSQSVIVCQGCF